MSIFLILSGAQRGYLNLFIFNCLTLNTKLFIFKLFDVKFLFSENHFFRKQKRTVSDFKLARENDDLLPSRHNKFLRYRTMCNSILKCGFPAKGIELARFVLFEILGVLQFWGSRFRPCSVRKFAKYKWDYEKRNFSVLDKIGEVLYLFST